MFPKKPKIIIAIRDNKLEVWQISFKALEPVVEKKTEREFTLPTLAGVLTQVKQELKIDSARLLLPEDKTYLELLKLPLETSVTRDLVLEKARETIPEVLEEGYFDWRQVGTDPPAGEAGEKNLKIQVLAVAKNYLSPILEAAQEAKVTMEAFEPFSLALAR